MIGQKTINHKVQRRILRLFLLRGDKVIKLVALILPWIGRHSDEVLEIEPCFEYDELEEINCSNRGIHIETDPSNDLVLWVSVFIKEIKNQGFESGTW
jgi:hypothetical protein